MAELTEETVLGQTHEPALCERVARMKARLLGAPYEICMARALHFTRAYRATEGRAPHYRNAFALKRTLERQLVRIEPDEWIVGNKTGKFLAAPLSVERGDFLRSLQLEIRDLDRKKRPFLISKRDVRLFEKEILAAPCATARWPGGCATASSAARAWTRCP